MGDDKRLHRKDPERTGPVRSFTDLYISREAGRARGESLDGEQAEDIACLYTDGDAWNRLTAFDEMIKHIVAASESLIRQNPSLRDALLAAFRESFAYSERNMDEVADVFVKTYGGDRKALLISARYPRVEFTFTDSERRLAQRQMEMFVEVGRLLRNAPIENFFAM